VEFPDANYRRVTVEPAFLTLPNFTGRSNPLARRCFLLRLSKASAS
jgi:hypothetical protein